MEASNVKAMRDALEFADEQLRRATEDYRHGTDLVYLVGCMRTVATVCRAALAELPRNCDVGTEQEQADRYEVFCAKHFAKDRDDDPCGSCPLSSQANLCKFAWAQMLYKKGGEK